MQGEEKKTQNLNRCEHCAMPAFKNGPRHMERYHPDLAEVPFRKLK